MAADAYIMNLQSTGLSPSRSDTGISGVGQAYNFTNPKSAKLEAGFTKLACNLRQSISRKTKMAVMIQHITDEWLEQLRLMPKTVTTPRTKWTLKNPGHRQRKFQLRSVNEDKEFFVFLRKCVVHENNFSCGINFVHGGNSKLPLARYNGPGHVHFNPPEYANRVINFRPHIHRTTERSYLQGKKLDSFAEETDRFDNFFEALQCLVEDFNVIGLPVEHEFGELFDDNGH